MQLSDDNEVPIKLLSDNGVGLTEKVLNFVLDYTKWKDFLPMIEKVIHFADSFSWSCKFMYHSFYSEKKISIFKLGSFSSIFSEFIWD